MYLLDTDTLSHLYAGHARVAERLAHLTDPDVGTTIVTKAEMIRGRIDFLLKTSTGAELLRAQHWFLRTEQLRGTWGLGDGDLGTVFQFCGFVGQATWRLSREERE